MSPSRAVSLLRQFQSNWLLALKHALGHGYGIFFAYTDISWEGE